MNLLFAMSRNNRQNHKDRFQINCERSTRALKQTMATKNQQTTSDNNTDIFAT